MSKVVREDIDNLNAVVTVTLEKSDYMPKFQAELNKYRKQGQMKGFRKGRTPLSVIKKMYGKSILAELINNQLQQELYGYLQQEDIKFLGQPLPAEGQDLIDFDLKNLEDFEFKFDLGLAPEFEVQGLEDNYEKLAVDVKDELVTEELEALQKRNGKQTPVEEAIEENDMLKIKAVEADKEDGLETTFSILVSRTTESVQSQLIGLKQGAEVRLNLFEIEPNTDEKYVRKYFLNLEDEDDTEVVQEYDCTIEEVNRLMPAELDEAFLKQAFGEDVESEEAAREKLKEQISGYYSSQASALLSRDIQDHLIEANTMDLPEAFLKKWMLASSENATEALVEKEFEQFRKSLTWSLIRSKLAKELEIKVEEQEIQNHFSQQILNYFGGASMPNMEAVIQGTTARMMEDKEQVEKVYEELLTNKLFRALEEKATLTEKVVSKEDFEEEIKKAQAEVQASQAALSSEEEE
jgi:trigger factor